MACVILRFLYCHVWIDLTAVLHVCPSCHKIHIMYDSMRSNHYFFFYVLISHAMYTRSVLCAAGGGMRRGAGVRTEAGLVRPLRRQQQHLQGDRRRLLQSQNALRLQPDRHLAPGRRQHHHPARQALHQLPRSVSSFVYCVQGLRGVRGYIFIRLC